MDTSITITVGLNGMIIIVSVLAFLVINIFLYKYYNNKIRYNKSDISALNHLSQYVILLCGLIVYPLFKKQIKDAIKIKASEIRLYHLHQELMMRNMGAEVNNDVAEEIKMLNRTCKLIKLKYNNKNFVIKGIFNIFVKDN